MFEAVSLMNVNRFGVVLVADDSRKLVGVISDGDVRRQLLAGILWNQ